MNITDLYSTRIQKTFDEDNEEIVSILNTNLNKTLKLINYYEGLPLSYPATVTAIERGIVDMDVKAEQAVSIEQSRSAFIRSPLFKHDVFAQAQYVNIKKHAVSFAKFSYVEIMAERRNFLRIALVPKPKTVIESPLGIIEGELYDISLSGVSVLIDHYCPLTVGTESTIRFVLRSVEQDTYIKVNVPATLINYKDDALPYKFIFSICPDKLLERQLSQYIFQRQIEIIKEIKEAV